MNMITANHNYDNGYIAHVNIELPNMPSSVDVGSLKLLLKGEFHISLICAKRIAPLIDNSRAGEIEAEIVETFIGYASKNDMIAFQLKDEFYYVEKDGRASLVVMAEVPGIVGFFNFLSEKYGVELPVQPTHITLYTKQPEAGIGILSYDELSKTGKIVGRPVDLKELLPQSVTK